MCGKCRESDLFMKIKASGLKGKALDYMVAIAKGISPSDIRIAHDRLYRWCRDEDGRLNNSYQTGPEFLFHKLWEAAGPIIERERICLNIGHDGVWLACIKQNYEDRPEYLQAGKTPLEAAMRCYVASKLASKRGDEVEIPGELL